LAQLPLGSPLGDLEDHEEEEQRKGHEQCLVPASLVGHDRTVPFRQQVVSTTIWGETGPDMRDELMATIEVIRPALQADGGDIVVRDVDEETGKVTVELVGACGTCPASTMTMRAGIERILKDRVEGVTEVVAV
jgi:Fe-S cluster biogenesis protein NfuA